MKTIPQHIMAPVERVVRYCFLKALWGKGYEAERLRTEDFTLDEMKVLV